MGSNRDNLSERSSYAVVGGITEDGSVLAK